MLLIVSFTYFVLIWSVNAASDGVKGEGCSSMYPGHGASKQDGASPYKLSTSSQNYGCFTNVTITLTSNEVLGFKGFLCQARRNLPEYVTYGTLISTGSVPMINKCEQTGSLSHSNPSVKSSVTFVWSAPDFDVGDISIICTVVKEFGIFWTNIVSPMMTHTASCQTIPTSTSNVTSSPDVTVSTTTSTYTNSTSSISDTYCVLWLMLQWFIVAQIYDNSV